MTEQKNAKQDTFKCPYAYLFSENTVIEYIEDSAGNLVGAVVKNSEGKIIEVCEFGMGSLLKFYYNEKAKCYHIRNICKIITK